MTREEAVNALLGQLLLSAEACGTHPDELLAEVKARRGAVAVFDANPRHVLAVLLHRDAKQGGFAGRIVPARRGRPDFTNMPAPTDEEVADYRYEITERLWSGGGAEGRYYRALLAELGDAARTAAYLRYRERVLREAGLDPATGD